MSSWATGCGSTIFPWCFSLVSLQTKVFKRAKCVATSSRPSRSWQSVNAVRFGHCLSGRRFKSCWCTHALLPFNRSICAQWARKPLIAYTYFLGCRISTNLMLLIFSEMRIKLLPGFLAPILLPSRMAHGTCTVSLSSVIPSGRFIEIGTVWEIFYFMNWNFAASICSFSWNCGSFGLRLNSIQHMCISSFVRILGCAYGTKYQWKIQFQATEDGKQESLLALLLAVFSFFFLYKVNSFILFLPQAQLLRMTFEQHCTIVVTFCSLYFINHLSIYLFPILDFIFI